MVIQRVVTLSSNRNISLVRSGQVVKVVFAITLSPNETFTLPWKPVISDSQPLRWGSGTIGYVDIGTNGLCTVRELASATNCFCSFCYITND